MADIHLDTSRLGELVDAFLAKMKGEGMKHVARESATQPKKVIAKRQMGMTPAPAAAEPVPDGKIIAARAERAKRFLFAASDEDQVNKLIGAQRDMLLRRMRSRVIDDLQREAITQVRTGGSPDDVVKRTLDKYLATSALKQDAGSVMSSVFNIGREQAAGASEKDVSTVTLSAVLDRAPATTASRWMGSPSSTAAMSTRSTSRR